MKAKRALKRLSRVERLLADVLDGFAGIGVHVRDLVGSAKASVVSAKQAMQQKATAPAGAKKPVQTTRPKKRKKKSAPAAGRPKASPKAAKPTAKKPAVKAHKPKQARLAARTAKPRSPKTTQTPSFSPAPEPLLEANTGPASAPDGSEPAPHSEE